MELLIKGTAKEIADLVLALQGRRKQDLFVSNIGDFKVAASAIHGTPRMTAAPMTAMYGVLGRTTMCGPPAPSA